MKKIVPVLICLFSLSIMTLNAQVIFEEDFEGGSLPAGWQVETNATDDGWSIDTPGGLSSGNFPVTANGSTRVAGTNDDQCNCDKSNDFLITSAFNLSGYSAAALGFDALYLDNTYQGDQENATVEISVDGGLTWTEILDIEGNAEWTSHLVDLTPYVGEEIVNLGFRYDDGNGWLYGFALDNIIVQTPPELEAELVEVNIPKFGETNLGAPIKGTIYNGGVNAINSLDISYTVDGSAGDAEQFTGLTIDPFTFYEFEFVNSWQPAAAGDYEIEVTIDMVNGGLDEDQSNNSDDTETQIYEQVVVPNKIDEFILAPPVLEEVADSGDGLDKPTDLDFFPILGKDELWIINERTENAGGSTVTIADASSGNPSDFWERVDGNSWHFMSLPSAMAFSSDNFNFANSPGVQDANHNGGTFTGPSLWSSDPEIYAQDPGPGLNGSHLDMLHGSPTSRGIAHEVDNVFWVYDDWNDDIVRYDFVEDHGPGYDDHSDAIVRRYRDIDIDGDGDIPNHMILDKSTGWLYFVDNGEERVMRLDINSGTGMNTLALINEPLAEHSEVTGFTVETIIEDGLEKPCGIELFENRLLVGDYETGDIVVYDLDNNFEELGRIPTDFEGLTGIKVGPKGNIWYTNREEETLHVASPGQPSSTTNLEDKVTVTITPNPTSGLLTVYTTASSGAEEAVIQVMNTSGQLMMEVQQTATQQRIDLSTFPAGIYIVTVQGESFHQTEKVILAQ